MNTNDLKLKANLITFSSELPSGNKYLENTMIAVPAKEKNKFNVYTWYEGRWVYTCAINKSDFDLKELKDAYNDLNNAVNKLTKIAANIESDEMFLKLGKITNKILQAKYELADDVLEHLE